MVLFFVLAAWVFGVVCGWLLFPTLEREYQFLASQRLYKVQP